MKKVKVGLTIKESTKRRVAELKRCDRSVSISKILDELIAEEYSNFITGNPSVKEAYCKCNFTISPESRKMMDVLKANGINISSMLDRRINEKCKEYGIREV